jgi:hypothetical protein
MKQQTAKSQSLKPLLVALQEVNADSRAKSKAFHFLRTDLSTLHTEEDFKRAFDGLFAAQQILGALDPNYRRCLAEMGKTLAFYSKRSAVRVRDDFVPLLFFLMENGFHSIVSWALADSPEQELDMMAREIIESFRKFRANMGLPQVSLEAEE